MQRVITYLILISFVACGGLLIYRSQLGTSDLSVVQGKVLTRQIEPVSTHKGNLRFDVIFTLENEVTKLGIYAGVSAKEDALVNGIKIGQVYTFLVDPTVTKSNGVNLGVREIRSAQGVVYRESRRAYLIAGMAMSLMGVFGLVLIKKYRKR
jgi:hypothetical protein